MMGEGLEVLRKIMEDGITIFTVIAFLGFVITMYESRRKRLRYERMESKIDAIGEKVGYEWNGQQNEFVVDLRSLKAWHQSFSAVISRVGYLLRRGKKMNQNINWVTLFLSVFGTLKLALQPFGIDLSHITDDQINNIVNGIAALLAIYGVFATHRIKSDADQAPAQPKPQLTDPDKFIQG